MKTRMAIPDSDAETIPVPLAGKWWLVGGTTTRLEINPDGSGYIDGSMWGRERVEWSVSENRLCATAERGSGSAGYAINGDELVLSRAQGLLLLVAGTYTPTDAWRKADGIEGVLW